MQTPQLIQVLLPLRSAVMTLRWLAPSQPGFLHHVPLHAWLRNLAGSPENFSDYLIVEPLENGHISYQTGDHYRLRITALNGGEMLLDTLLQRLRKLPGSARGKKQRHFADNLELVSMEDSFEHHRVRGAGELSTFDENDLWLETALWAQRPFFKLAFTTPARLVRQKNPAEPAAKGKQRYCRDRHHLSWPLLSQRLTDTFINLYQRKTGERLQRAPWPEAQVHSVLAFWLEHSYAHNPNGQKKDASGMLAQLHISLPPDFPADLLILLVFGQYTGIGQHRSFGMGQYQLRNEYQEASYPRPGAAQSLLDRALQEENLSLACAQMYQRSAEFDPADDEREQAEAHTELLQMLHKKRQQIQQHSYQPGALQALEVDKPDGGSRLLSIPSWLDRTLQRAVTNILAPGFEQLWMKHSYGYRKGHSRLNARDQINRHIQQGYRWVLESDIESFFDSVNWQNLEQRLQLLLPNEPLVPLLMQWVSCQHDANGQDSQPRTQGLPQGAPVSPLLANLLLDDFDQDMLARGHHIIRYADDFVLLFKTEQEAQAALPDIRASLREHGLDINPEKTHIVPAESGFRYLGYLFIDGYAIETRRADRSQEPAPAVALKHQTRPPAARKRSIGERDDLGTILIVAGELAMLFTDKQRLVVEQYDQKTSHCWHSLAAVLLVGPHQITTPALRSAMQHSVPIHFANAFGQYQGVAAGQDPNPLGADFWLLQMQHLQHADHAFDISKELVKARLAGQIALLQRRDKTAPELDKYHRIRQKISRASDMEQLRGYEGEAAKHLWQFMQRQLAKEWQFTGRNRRPPKDPINAMLSLGYSFMYSLVDSINRSVGLYPWQGAYHQNHGRHKTLASDLMEPYRYIVERVVLTLVNRGQLKPDAFAIGERGCQMSSEARKTLLNELLIQLTRQTDKAPSLIDSIKNQAISLALSCKTGQTFHAWRPKQ